MYKNFGKRFFDIFLGSILFIIFIPVLFFIFLLVKIFSTGPAFYKGERVGLNQKIFFIYKFRTMVTDAEKLGGSNTASNDPRITGIGRVLRRTKLDELPQFLNVIKGDMSFVGPRPDTPFYASKIDPESQKKVFSVRPGITDYATISNIDEEEMLSQVEDPDLLYVDKILPEKVQKQCEYVDDLSVSTDLGILWTTFKAVVQKIIS